MLRHFLIAVTLVGLGAATLAGCSPDSRIVHREQLELGVLDATALELVVGAGSLDVIGEPARDRVLLDVTLRTNRAVITDDDRARESLDIQLQQTEAGERILSHVLLDDGPGGYYADVVLRVPSALGIDAEDSSGDIIIEDVAWLALTDDSGDIEVRRIAGGAQITDDSGQIVIDTVGSASIVDGSGDVECYDVEGDVDVVDDSGGLRFERVGGTVRVRDGSGDVVAIDVGDLEMISDGSGNVERR